MVVVLRVQGRLISNDKDWRLDSSLQEVALGGNLAS
jgi:hypothetical protein